MKKSSMDTGRTRLNKLFNNGNAGFVWIFLFFLVSSFPLRAQPLPDNRLILIGDAGQINPRQKALLQWAASKVIPGKTTVVFLGDNIYPTGMELPGTSDSVYGEAILVSQFKPLRDQDAPVVFIPGNHDWDRSGEKGLEKIKAQWRFLEEQHDPDLKMLPPDGCPDPIAVDMGELSVIVFDSEWWLFPFSKKNDSELCDCHNKNDVLEKLKQLLQARKNKTVLLAAHHPFQTYGSHGGKFSLKDHVFPLTNLNPHLYVPLPVIGSLYPLLRTVFTHPEDKTHPLYREMIREIRGVAAEHPNLVHVAGHDHGLQLIDDGFLQVVSGSGAKNTATYKGKGSLFATRKNGFVVADLMPGKKLKFTFFTTEEEAADTAFRYERAYVFSTDSAVEWAPIAGDSALVRVHPSYNEASSFKRKIFGENFREEWAAEVKLPVFRLSSLHGGMVPVKKGGGMQTTSLRLEDPEGNEWVLRSVQKSPDVLLPEGLRETFARDWVDDVMSAQHPFSALIMPPLANAAGVPHTEPVIGLVAPDSALGEFLPLFANQICLLERREPLGDSDNTPKMLEKIRNDNDDVFDGEMFLRARLLDLLVGDWDRHEDQWRWVDRKKGKNKFYIPVPRDRDQVLHKTEGLLPKMAARPWLLPTLQGFEGDIPSPKYSLLKTSFAHPYPSAHFTDEKWNEIVSGFVSAMTDSVLEEGLKRFPPEIRSIRNEELLAQLKQRRDGLKKAMSSYRDFISRKVDILASDKNEWADIKEDPEGKISFTLRKLDKNLRPEDTLMFRVFDPAVTKELRLYLGKGKDSVSLRRRSASPRLRIIGGKDVADIAIHGTGRKVKVYARPGNLNLYGSEPAALKYGTDSAHTAFMPVNLYNFWTPSITAGLNIDDGFILGGGFRYTGKEGFRKEGFTHIQEFMLAHSFSTTAYRMRYKGEWNRLFGRADLLITGIARAPDNTINFFGRGNETLYEKTGNHRRFYRTRFSVFQLEPALQWRRRKGLRYYIGPTAQYYKFDTDDNGGRFIEQTGKIGSYDSLTVNKAKFHAGIATGLELDRRNRTILPSWGYHIGLRLQAMKGGNEFSGDLAQLIPEISLYNNLNARSTIVMANRIGGLVTFGKSAFYQSAFLGGQGNLLGFRQFRFAGDHSFYHNLEFRIKLATVASYILPGQLGLIAFNDVGRVWQRAESSQKWHQGAGGGFYFAPAGISVFSLQMGKSVDGWYPYFTMGLRF